MCLVMHVHVCRCFLVATSEPIIKLYLCTFHYFYRLCSALYKFLEVNFKDVPDIPVPLLKAISNCFQSRKEVCRLCFYEERVLSGRVHSSNICSNGGHPWNKPILVIPGGSMCLLALVCCIRASWIVLSLLYISGP